jgi:hypothetical protein
MAYWDMETVNELHVRLRPAKSLDQFLGSIPDDSSGVKERRFASLSQTPGGEETLRARALLVEVKLAKSHIGMEHFRQS